MACLQLYEPIGTLKPVADGVYIVDGPIIGMRYVVGKLPFTTRTTIVKLSGGDLWIHSPTPLNPELKAEIDALGRPAHLIAPNRIHYWWIGDWKAAYPGARTYAAPKVARDAAKMGRLAAFDEELGAEPPATWGHAFDQWLIPGDFMTEVEFFHRPSKTLVLTDLIENFEPGKISCAGMRFLMWIGGVADPNGGTPRDLGLTFLRHKPKIREAVRAMLAAAPERVILSHGRWYPENGTKELARALRWAI